MIRFNVPADATVARIINCEVGTEVFINGAGMPITGHINEFAVTAGDDFAL